MTQQSYELQYPLHSGEQTLRNITIQKPMAGQLRGIRITDVVTFDILCAEKLLPRITELTPADVSLLDPYDVTAIMQIVSGFFVIDKQGIPMMS